MRRHNHRAPLLHLLLILCLPCACAASSSSASTSTSTPSAPVIRPRSNVWTTLPAELDAPRHRFGHASTIDTNNNLFIFGGVTDRSTFHPPAANSSSLSSELWLYNGAINNFFQQVLPSPTPQPPACAAGLSYTQPNGRLGATLTYAQTFGRYSSMLLLFGGYTPVNALLQPSNELFVLALGGWTGRCLYWVRLRTTGTPPPPRAFHAAALFTTSQAGHERFCVWTGQGTIRAGAGSGGSPLSDSVPGNVVYCLLAASYVWYQISPMGSVSPIVSRTGAFSFIVPPAGDNSNSGLSLWGSGGGSHPLTNGKAFNLVFFLSHNATESNVELAFDWRGVQQTSAPLNYAAACWSSSLQAVLIYGGTFIGQWYFLHNTFSATLPPGSSLFAMRPTPAFSPTNPSFYENFNMQARVPIFPTYPPSTLMSSLECNAISSADQAPGFLTSGAVMYGGYSSASLNIEADVWATTLSSSAYVAWQRLPSGEQIPNVQFPLVVRAASEVLVIGGTTVISFPTVQLFYRRMPDGAWQHFYSTAPNDEQPAQRFACGGGVVNSSYVLLFGGLQRPSLATSDALFNFRFIELSDVWQLHVPSRAWTQLRNSTAAGTSGPAGRGFAAVDVVDGFLYVFGGCTQLPQDGGIALASNAMDSFWRFDATVTRQWDGLGDGAAAKASGVPWPSSRCGASGVGLILGSGADPASSTSAPAGEAVFVMFGGISGANKVLNDLWIFHPTYSPASSSSSLPPSSPRGGVWEQVQPAASSVWPSPRAFFGATALSSQRKMAIQGGATAAYFLRKDSGGQSGGGSAVSAPLALTDTLVFDLARRTFSRVDTTSSSLLLPAVAPYLVDYAGLLASGEQLGLAVWGGLDSESEEPISADLLYLRLACNADEYANDYATGVCQPCDGRVEEQGDTSNSVCIPASSSGVPVFIPVLVAIALAAVLGLLTYFVVVPRIRARRLAKYTAVFVSYRVATDADIAHQLVDMLENAEIVLPLKRGRTTLLKCYLDTKDLQFAENWREGFLSGLIHSCLFVPVVSEAGLEPILHMTEATDKEDNVLLEYETALEMRAEGRMQILPLLVGRRLSAREGGEGKGCDEYNFRDFGPHRFPSIPSPSKGRNVRHTITDIFSFQGVKMDRYLVAGGGASGGSDGRATLASELIDIISKALLQSAWGNTDDAAKDCLQLHKHWRGPGCLEEGEEGEEEGEGEEDGLGWDADPDGSGRASRSQKRGSLLSRWLAGKRHSSSSSSIFPKAGSKQPAGSSFRGADLVDVNCGLAEPLLEVDHDLDADTSV